MWSAWSRAEIRRLVLVERRSQWQVARMFGVVRDTVSRAVVLDVPPRYVRPPTVSKLDPFREWICAQLAADPSISSLRLREMAIELGFQDGKSIFDEYVREIRPRFVVPRTFQRTIYRPGELIQCDLWEPRELIVVGHGQQRRGWVVTSEVCSSHAIAGTLVFSKEAPDILWGLSRNLQRFRLSRKLAFSLPISREDAVDNVVDVAVSDPLGFSQHSFFDEAQPLRYALAAKVFSPRPDL